MKKVFLLIISFIFFTGCGNKIESGIVTCNQKDDLLSSNNSFLIDVRDSSEYLEGHLEGAINISYDKILEGVRDKNIGLNDSIIVYCRSGVRSKRAYDSLKSAGYKNVYDLGSISNCNGR